MKRGLGAALLLLCCKTAIAALPAACPADLPASAAGLPPDEAALHLQLDRAPDEVLANACAALRAGNADEDRIRFNLARALIVLERRDEADALLAALVETARDDALRGEAALVRGETARSLRDFAGAAPHFATARRYLPQDTPPYARLLIGEAALARYRRDLPTAQSQLEAAERLLAKLGRSQSWEAVALLDERAEFDWERQDIAACVRDARAEVEMIRALAGPDSPQQLEPYATLGAVLSVQTDYAGAAAALEEAHRIIAANRFPPPEARAGVLHNLAALYLDRGESAKALAAGEEGLAFTSAHFGAGSPYSMSQRLTIAAALIQLARYAEARDTLAQAERDALAQGVELNTLVRLRLRLHQTSASLRLGDIDAASAYLAEAKAAMPADAKLGYYRAWAAKFDCALAAGREDWPAADVACGDVVRHFATVLEPTPAMQIGSQAGRCLAEVSGKLPLAGCDVVEHLLPAAGEANPIVRSFAQAALASRAEAAGETDRALELRSAALATALLLGAPDPLWSTEDAFAQTLRRRGERELAVFFGKKAIESIEAMRTQFEGDSARFERGFLANKYAVYRRVADWLAEDGRIPEALDVLRLLKREEVYDFLERGGDAASMRHRAPEQTPREAALARRWQRLASPSDTASEQTRLSKLAERRRITPEETKQLQRLTGSLQHDEQRLADEIRAFVSNAPQEAAEASPPGAHADLPPPHTARAWLFPGEGRLQLVVETPHGRSAQSLPIAPEQVAREIGRLLEAIAARADVQSAASALYRQIGAPLDAALAADPPHTLTLWLDGALRYLPFAVLYDGSHFLGEKYVLQLADPAPTQIAAKTPPRAVRVLGVARATGGLPALPGVTEELCGIVRGPFAGWDEAPCPPDIVRAARIPGAGWVNAAFSEARLQQVLADRSDYSLLHVGTHFRLRPGNISRSWLLLGDGTHLPLTALQRYDFSGLELVTLSACETAVGGANGEEGRELDGLAAVVERRGAKQVLASLWQVEDRSTARLMRDFYAALARPGSSPAEALHAAQDAMRTAPDVPAAWRHPYFWAAFVLIGSPT